MTEQTSEEVKLSPLATLLLRTYSLGSNPDADPEEWEKIEKDPLGLNATKEEIEAAELELFVAGFITTDKKH